MHYRDNEILENINMRYILWKKKKKKKTWKISKGIRVTLTRTKESTSKRVISYLLILAYKMNL